MHKQKPKPEYNADDVWAAACAAQRVNNKYIKFVEPDAIESQKSNRDLLMNFLTDPSTITDKDREQGQLIRKYYKGLTFKVLQGKKLSAFDVDVMQLANRDVITSFYDVAVITSLPSCYERNVKRDQDERRVDNAKGGFVGVPGNKVELEIEVLRCVFSKNYFVYFVTGVTSEDQAVFFSYKKDLKSGLKLKIKGTVKAHRDNSTQLNRVKVL